MSASQVITNAQGVALGNEFCESQTEGFGTSNFSRQSKLLADQVSWSWSGNGPNFTGNGPKAAYFQTMNATWNPLCSTHATTSRRFAVDTGAGIVCLFYTTAGILDANGTVRRVQECHVTLDISFELHLNADHKITRIIGHWNPSDEGLLASVNHCLTELGLPRPPKPSSVISEDEGKRIGQNLLDYYAEGYAVGHFSSEKNLLAPVHSYQWSSGASGTGTPDEYWTALNTAWVPMLSFYQCTNVNMTVDTHSGTVRIIMEATGKFDGHGKVPGSHTQYTLPQMIEITIDGNHKISRQNVLWNMNDETFQGLVAAVTAVKLSSQQGHAVANRFINIQQDSFRNADFSASAGMYADTLSWKWSGEAAHCSGTGTVQDYFAVVAKTWQFIVSAHEMLKPEIVVDTNNAINSITYTTFACIDGRNAANRTDDSFFTTNLNWMLKVDANGKIYSVDAVWDSADSGLHTAVAAVLKQSGAPVPAVPKAIISHDEGKALTQKFLNAWIQSFPAKDTSAVVPFLASNVSWVHPNGGGSGSPDDYKNALGFWSNLISRWVPSSPRFVIDGPAGTINATFGVGLNVDGHGAVTAPGTFCTLDFAWRIQVNAEHKITSIHVVCDLADLNFASALNAVISASK
jgi:hypothetical protein